MNKNIKEGEDMDKNNMTKEEFLKEVLKDNKIMVSKAFKSGELNGRVLAYMELAQKALSMAEILKKEME